MIRIKARQEQRIKKGKPVYIPAYHGGYGDPGILRLRIVMYNRDDIGIFWRFIAQQPKFRNKRYNRTGWAVEVQVYFEQERHTTALHSLYDMQVIFAAQEQFCDVRLVCPVCFSSKRAEAGGDAALADWFRQITKQHKGPRKQK